MTAPVTTPTITPVIHAGVPAAPPMSPELTALFLASRSARSSLHKMQRVTIALSRRGEHTVLQTESNVRQVELAQAALREAAEQVATLQRLLSGEEPRA